MYANLSKVNKLSCTETPRRDRLAKNYFLVFQTVPAIFNMSYIFEKCTLSAWIVISNKTY